MVKAIKGSYVVKYHPEGLDGEEAEIDFTPPFRRISMLTGLEEATGRKFPSAEEYHTEGTSHGLC